MKKTWILGLIILLNTSIACSDVVNIVVVGLFSDQAVVEINKKRRLLKVGETSPEGIKLISANSHRAVLEKNNIKKEYLLGTEINANFSPPSAQTVVSLWPTNGMYLTVGSINDYSVNFIVDTGASAVALNVATAKRLGLDYLNGRKIGVKTASGVVRGYNVILDKVQLGDITLHNIRAMVLDGKEPERALLGMTFLSQLDIHRKDQRMDLMKKY